MARLDEPGSLEKTVLTGPRLTVLALGTLIAPAIGLHHALADDDTAMVVVQIVSIVLFLMVVGRMSLLVRDTAALSREVERRDSQVLFESLVRQSSDLITVLDTDGRVTYQSPSIERVLGWEPEQIVGRHFAELMPPNEAAELETIIATVGGRGTRRPLQCTLQCKKGGERHFELLCSPLTSEPGVVLNGRDVSDRRRFEAELTHQAFHDSVTGLANRALFFERARHALATARRNEGSLAVLFLDLDDFKTINDSLGHAAGDEVLIEVGRRIAESIRASDTAARFGGDEFAVLLEDVERGAGRRRHRRAHPRRHEPPPRRRAPRGRPLARASASRSPSPGRRRAPTS